MDGSRNFAQEVTLRVKGSLCLCVKASDEGGCVGLKFGIVR